MRYNNSKLITCVTLLVMSIFLSACQTEKETKKTHTEKETEKAHLVEEIEKAHLVPSAPHVYHKKGSTGLVNRKGMFDGEAIEVKLTTEDTEGRYTVMDFTFGVGFDSSPGHYHSKHAETFFIIEGRMEFMVEGEKQILGPGDLVYIPPGTYHSARTLDNKTARTVFIFEPAGFEDVIESQNALTDEQRNDPEFMTEFYKTVDYHFDPARGHDHDK